MTTFFSTRDLAVAALAALTAGAAMMHSQTNENSTFRQINLVDAQGQVVMQLAGDQAGGALHIFDKMHRERARLVVGDDRSNFTLSGPGQSGLSPICEIDVDRNSCSASLGTSGLGKVDEMISLHCNKGKAEVTLSNSGQVTIVKAASK